MKTYLSFGTEHRSVVPAERTELITRPMPDTTSRIRARARAASPCIPSPVGIDMSNIRRRASAFPPIVAVVVLLLLALGVPVRAQEGRGPQHVGRMVEPEDSSVSILGYDYIPRTAKRTLNDSLLTSRKGTGTPDTLVRIGSTFPNYCVRRKLHSAQLDVRLDLGDDYTYGVTPFSTSVKFTIDCRDSLGTTLLFYTPPTLNITQHGPEQLYHIDLTGLDLTTFESVHKILVSIVTYGKDPTVSANVRLTTSFTEEYAIEARRAGSMADTPMVVLDTIPRNCTDNPVLFSWRVATSCNDTFPNYQVQILRLYNFDTSATYGDEKKVKAKVDWRQALTVETGSGVRSMPLTIAEGSGYYIWRVRPIGSYYDGGITNDTNWGAWSTAPPTDTVLNFTSTTGLPLYAFFYNQFDQDINWAYSRAFTEGTRISEGMQYVTPALLPKQSQGRIRSRDSVLVGQTAIDYSGRPSLGTMAAPSGPGAIEYRSGLLTKGGSPYAARNFDSAGKELNPDAASGGKVDAYYSSSNPDSSIASAQHYPFSRALANQDGLGRPQEMSGAGDVYRLGSSATGKDRTVKMFYGGVSDRELIRMFGDEAPADTSVVKVVSVDPNKIATVQYIGEGGAVIATAVSMRQGDVLLTPLREDSLSETISDTISGNRRQGKFEFNSTKRLVFIDTTSLKIKYSIVSDTLKSSGCVTSCSTCDYWIRLYLRNVENPDSVRRYDLVLSGASDCNSIPQRDTTITIVVPPGSYVIERRVLTNNVDPTTITASNPYGTTYAELYRNVVANQMRTTILNDSLQHVLGFLDRENLDSLYLYLNVDPETTAEKEVGTTCCPISVPILPPDCGIDPCHGSTDSSSAPDYEAYLISTWGSLYGVDSTNLNKYFGAGGQDKYPSTTQYPNGKGAFNRMIRNMMAERVLGQPVYRCKDLWQCWTYLVKTYATLKYMDTTHLVVNKDFDLLETFLNCIGKRYIDTTSTPYGTTTGYLTHAYKYVQVISGTTFSGCASAVGFSTSWINNVDSSGRWSELADCMRARDPNRKGTAGSDIAACIDSAHGDRSKIDTCLLEANNRDYTNMLSACEQRRGEFRDAVIAAFSWQVREDSLDCMVQKLIDSCKNDCRRTVFWDGSGHIDHIGDSTELKRIQWVYSYKMHVDRPNPSCSDSSRYSAGNSRPYHDQAIQYLNNAVQSYSRDSVGVNGGYWNFKNALRKAYPQLVSRIADSIVFVRYHDTTAKFVRLNGCELWYKPDTLFYGTPEDPHPLVGHLNRWLDMMWNFPVSANSGYWKKYYSADSTIILRVDSTGGGDAGIADHPEIYQLRSQFFDSARFQFINGTIASDSLGKHISCGLSPTLSGVSYTWEDVVHLHLIGSIGNTSLHFPPHQYITGREYVVTGSTVDTLWYLETPFRFFSSDSSFVLKAPAISGGIVGLERTIPANITRIRSILDTPYTSIGGFFGEDDEHYLTYNTWKWGTASTPDSIRLFQIRFYSYISQKVSSDICDTMGCPAICFKWIPRNDSIVGADTAHVVTCKETAVRKIRESINRQINDCIQNALSKLEDRYLSVCANPNEINDHLVLEYPLHQYHYTLYYYDRAGNLVKTVPPKGVKLTSTSRATHPSHTLYSEYDYNSLGQPVRARTPDGDTAFFYYDRVGRLRFSQDQRQRNSGSYSYVKFDYLGRVIQGGKSTDSIASNHFLAHIDEPGFPTGGTERTYMVYSPTSSVDYLDGTPQKNLRDRVSYVYNDDSVKTYYSYDVHGNVEWCAQEIPGMPRRNYVKYDYDLISGNVNRIDYNEGRGDQFHHRYIYDADNRLVLLETSRDGVIWDRDAAYSYYAHGPLKRRELGEDKLQGLDYTYTLQGQLKAVNHPSLTSGDDPGHDGASNNFPADSFAVQLGYFKGDFIHSGSKFDSTSALDPTSVPLYDGNIASTTSNIGHSIGAKFEGLTAETYRYDQLGRIDSSKFLFRDGAWKTPTGGDYATSYDYDPNGNLDTLRRAGFDTSSATTMDNLRYKYKSGTNQLDHVEDAVTGRPYKEDLRNQSTANYSYDAVGNLISDASEGISSITWDQAGRVKTMSKSAGGTSTSVAYKYDAMGNRVRKVETNTTFGVPTTKTTYYVHDAQGVVMAIYESTCGGLLISSPDYDHDGVPDITDNCDSTFNPDQLDFDGDGIGDVCDNDDDNDGIPDLSDACPYWPGAICPPGDKDGDGIPDGLDHCPMSRNTSTTDTDGDGIPDACDYDLDGDGISNEDDNCPWISNPGQEDSDHDGKGDVCAPCQIQIAEFPIYGVGREGVMRPDTSIYVGVPTEIYTREVGRKHYELNDHLGNARMIIGDVKLPISTPGMAPFKADVESYANMYPFGMSQPGRYYNRGFYRYGYNGMEVDSASTDDHYTSYFRQYDARLGRWWSNDPIGRSGESPYVGMADNPIAAADPSGADTAIYSSNGNDLSITILGDRDEVRDGNSDYGCKDCSGNGYEGEVKFTYSGPFEDRMWAFHNDEWIDATAYDQLLHYHVEHYYDASYDRSAAFPVNPTLGEFGERFKLYGRQKHGNLPFGPDGQLSPFVSGDGLEPADDIMFVAVDGVGLVARLGAAQLGRIGGREVMRLGAEAMMAGAERRELPLAKVLRAVKHVNPNPNGDVLRMSNCVNCAIATDATLAGRPAAALASDVTHYGVLEDFFGAKFEDVTGAMDIGRQLVKAGDGARGVVMGYTPGGRVGHVWNVINRNGDILFVDGQLGGIGVDNFEAFRNFKFLFTHK